MAWETRARGGRYYTRSRRVGGKVKREYVGSGETAAAIAFFDARERDQQQARRKEQQNERQESEALVRLMRWYFQAVENVLRAELTRAGFHQHDRGQWRKKRTPDMDTEVMQAAKAELSRRKDERTRMQTVRLEAIDTEIAVREAAVPDTEMERRAIINAAMNGDARLEVQALACIRAYPTETVLGWGNPMNAALDLVSPVGDRPGVKVVRAVIEDEYRLKQKQIEGDNPTPLERLLAERITAVRLQLTHFERLYEAKINVGGMSLAASDHHAKRIERVSKQYFRAIESLAKVRRLQVPLSIQVNIGEKQVNLSSG